MALTSLSNVIVPEVFAPYVQLLSTNLSLLVRSGVIVNNPALDSALAGGGYYVNMPAWNDLTDGEANVSDDANSDNIRPSTAASANDATPLNTTALKTVAMRNNRNQNWSSSDLASQLAGSDAMGSIASRVAAYWVRQDQLQLNSVIKGLVAGNATLVKDIAEGAGGTPAGPNLFSAEAMLDTLQLMGDHKQNLTAIAVHSAVQTRMQKLNLITFVAESDANIGFGTYMGKTLIVDDNLAVTSDGTNDEYFSIAYGAGAFSQGNGTPYFPTEVSREALAGNGGGQEVLTSRREYILHPNGFTVKAGLGAGPSATNTEYEASDAYAMTVARKLIPFAVLKSNG